MGARSRRKGAAGEREWCAELKRHGYHDAERNITQTRAGGGDVPVPPFMFEVKRYAKIRVREFLDQAVAALPKHPQCEMPVVAMREDGRTDWMVMLRAEDFFALVAKTRGMGHHLPVNGVRRFL